MNKIYQFSYQKSNIFMALFILRYKYNQYHNYEFLIFQNTRHKKNKTAVPTSLTPS